MFTTWDQVQDWIKDNNFARWIFYKTNPENRDETKANDKIVDSSAFIMDDRDGKLEMTEKYLRMYGGKVWGLGFKTNSPTNGTACEARIDSVPAQGVQGVQPQVNIGEIESRVRKQVVAELEAERYKRERDEFEKEKRAFQKEQESVIGLLVHKIAPFAIAALQGNKTELRNVAGTAGLDAEEEVHTDPIKPIVADNPAPAEQPEEEQEVFTEAESDQLFELMARFKKVEPEYLKLIEAVVVMAENGDENYVFARRMLIH
jgi:hypothetical protein